MIMETRTKFGILAGLVIGVIVLCGNAGAQDAAKDKPVGPITEEGVTKIAVSATKAAHPTGKDVVLLKYSEPKRDGVLLVKMKVEYGGAISNNRYRADVLLEIRLPEHDVDPLVVTNIDFIDKNNATPPNRRKLKRLIEDLNSQFRMDKAK